MTDIVYLYPQSSCTTAYCQPSYDIPKGPETNLSVQNGIVSPYFQCYNRVELGSGIQPREREGWTELNPEVYLDKLAQGFDRVGCGSEDKNSPPVYLSRDPRQFDAPRAMYLPIDRPPMSGDVKLSQIYDKKYDGYGVGFTPYNMIRDGQIVYYIDKSIQDPFYKPVYSEPAKQTSILFKDPMGAMKPEMNRTPIVNTENPTVTTPENYPYCLSSIQDSQSFREDLIALQQRRHNQEKWSARWSNSSINN